MVSLEKFWAIQNKLCVLSQDFPKRNKRARQKKKEKQTKKNKNNNNNKKKPKKNNKKKHTHSHGEKTQKIWCALAIFWQISL